MQIQTNKGENFVHVNIDAGIVMTTTKNLRFLCVGTLHVSPKQFSQLYMIHNFVNKLYIQHAFYFLSSKTAACYTQL